MKTSQRAVIFLVISVFIVSVLGSAIFILADDGVQDDQHSTNDELAGENPIQTDFQVREEAIQNCNFAPQPDPLETPGVEPAFDIPSGEIAGLESTDLVVGTGDTVEAGDCIVAFYTGVLQDGTQFDGNFGTVNPAKFSLYGVIEGWEIGLQGMQVGGVRQLSIPANQAYGDQARGSIPANADLVFVVELVDIVEI